MYTIEEQQKARKKAMRLLEHMDRTEKGLWEKLIQGGFCEEAAEDAISYVKSFGYINDRRYAENYISSRIGTKSRQKILQELLQKGVDRNTAQEAWDELAALEEPDERACIRREIEKKYSPDTILEEKELRRLYGCLARRGFQGGDIFSVLEEMHITSRGRFENE